MADVIKEMKNETVHLRGVPRSSESKAHLSCLTWSTGRFSSEGSNCITTQALQARIAELEAALLGIEDLCQSGAGEDADMDAQEALMQIWEAARKVLKEKGEYSNGPRG